MNFSIKDLDHLAQLSHLTLSNAEKEAFAPQIDHVLDYMAKLSEVTIDQAVLASVPVPQMQLRDDVVTSTPMPLLADNAPDWDAASHAFFVPKISN
jgi:aspartyl-tRNA(Asn)/glutamyl-tRNA(Gln) amidotransferase subunit C